MAVPGTSTAYSTAAFIQASPKYVAGMWAFAGDGTLAGAISETSIAQGVYEWMDKAHTGTAAQFPKPAGIKELASSSLTIRLGNGQNVGPSPATDIYPSWYK
jgi:hypothetical protein